jgi:hypothetical protein
MSNTPVPKKLRRFPNGLDGDMHRLFSEMSQTERDTLNARAAELKAAEEWWALADKAAAKAELVYLRSLQPGDYVYRHGRGWLLSQPRGRPRFEHAVDAWEYIQAMRANPEPEFRPRPWYPSEGHGRRHGANRDPNRARWRRRR